MTERVHVIVLVGVFAYRADMLNIAPFGTGGFNDGAFVGMGEGVNGFGFGELASGAGVHPRACTGTGGLAGGYPFPPIMGESVGKAINIVITAMLAFVLGVALGGTGGSGDGMDIGVPDRRHLIVVFVVCTPRTLKIGISVRCAGGGGDVLVEVMAQCLGHITLVGIVAFSAHKNGIPLFSASRFIGKDLIIMPQGLYLVTGVGVSATSTHIIGITCFGTGGIGYAVDVVMPERFYFFVYITVHTFGADMGSIALIRTGRDYNCVRVSMDVFGFGGDFFGGKALGLRCRIFYSCVRWGIVALIAGYQSRQQAQRNSTKYQQIFDVLHDCFLSSYVILAILHSTLSLYSNY